MRQGIELLEDEEYFETVIPKTGFMFRNNDIIKVPFFIIWITIASLIAKHTFNRFHLFSTLFMVGAIFLTCYVLYTIMMRYRNTANAEYIITNQRVIFFRKSTEQQSVFFKGLDEISYENKGKDTGYITLGKIEDLFAGRGINMTDDKYVLDNLRDYKSTSELVKRLYAKSKKS